MSLEQNINLPAVKIASVKFPEFCNTLGTIPTSYKDSMSYYENLVWLCKFIEETVIPAVNENGEAVRELQELYVELKNYVDNYFNTLDITEEINKKLDEMVESGELQEIIGEYLQTLDTKMIFGFNTIEQMSQSTILKKDTFARTYGELTYNDGKGRYYVIQEILTPPTVDGVLIVNLNRDNLYAVAVPEMFNTIIGNLASLDTQDKTSVVNAINEVVGILDTLATNVDTLSGSVDTLSETVGTITTIVTTLTNSIGDLEDLDTTEKDDLVSAINEVVSKIGDLTTLETTEKSSLVDAINELVSAISTLNTNVGDLEDLDTTAKDDLVSAINELVANLGNLSNLDTQDKTSLVNAINEVLAGGGGGGGDTGTVLFSSSTGEDGNIVLSQAIENFNYVEIINFCNAPDGNKYYSTTGKLPVNRMIQPSFTFMKSDIKFAIITKRYTLEGTNATAGASVKYTKSSDAYENVQMPCVKIIGYH